jgi:hypothetical protein
MRTETSMNATTPSQPGRPAEDRQATAHEKVPLDTRVTGVDSGTAATAILIVGAVVLAVVLAALYWALRSG